MAWGLLRRRAGSHGTSFLSFFLRCWIPWVRVIHAMPRAWFLLSITPRGSRSISGRGACKRRNSTRSVAQCRRRGSLPGRLRRDVSLRGMGETWRSFIPTKGAGGEGNDTSRCPPGLGYAGPAAGKLPRRFFFPAHAPSFVWCMLCTGKDGQLASAVDTLRGTACAWFARVPDGPDGSPARLLVLPRYRAVLGAKLPRDQSTSSS